MKARIWFEAMGQRDQARGIAASPPRCWPEWARFAYLKGRAFHLRRHR